MSHATANVEVGPPHVHHMDAVTAYHAAKLGMWLFLATEILLFAGLFCTFALYQWTFPQEFHHASKELNWRLGGLNTLVLLFSSFTAAIAVDAAQRGNNTKVTRYLGITIVCGFIFLGIKYIEWSTKFHHGIFPGQAHFMSEGHKNFFGLYYTMTGLHALHVIIGMSLLVWVVMKSLKNRFGPTYYTPVEVGALYWHLVDLIWIYLFPVLYLVG